MRIPGDGQEASGRRDRSHRGQSLVEFALVLPMLLVLLLGVADFGRVFAAGITLEASARDAAEVAAQEYVQLVRNKPGGVLDAADYSRLHDLAIETVCNEGTTLPVRSLAVAGANAICSHDNGGTPEDIWPLAAVCIHDGLDPDCGSEAGSVAACPRLSAAWSNVNAGADPSGAEPLPYVEVRVCYEFATLFNVTNLNLPLGWSISVGIVHLERDRNFTVACYGGVGTGCY